MGAWNRYRRARFSTSGRRKTSSRRASSRTCWARRLYPPTYLRRAREALGFARHICIIRCLPGASAPSECSANRGVVKLETELLYDLRAARTPRARNRCPSFGGSRVQIPPSPFTLVSRGSAASTKSTFEPTAPPANPLTFATCESRSRQREPSLLRKFELEVNVDSMFVSTRTPARDRWWRRPGAVGRDPTFRAEDFADRSRRSRSTPSSATRSSASRGVRQPRGLQFDAADAPRAVRAIWVAAAEEEDVERYLGSPMGLAI